MRPASLPDARFSTLDGVCIACVHSSMRRRFEWDDEKAERNFRDHGIHFEEAIDAFFDPNRVELFDEGHSEDEARYVVLGFSGNGRLLFVCFAPVGDDATRLIHARVAERKWRRVYEEENDT